jgi:hypothetical protein
MKVLAVILLVYFALSAYLFFTQRSFLYFPPPPSDHGYPEETFQFKEARVQVIVLNEGKQHALLYFGGNAESVEHNAPAFMQHFPNHTLYLVQYRGYGKSTGNPTEANLYADALVIFDRVTQRHTSMSVIGRSLGSGIATLLATQKPIQTLILVTPFDSIEAMAQKLFPFFPISLLLQDKYNSLDRAKKIQTNTLLLLAENDQTVKAAHSEALAKAFVHKVATTITIPESSHNSISYHPMYYPAMRNFILASIQKP